MKVVDVLEISGVSYSYGSGPQVLYDVGFSVAPGEIVGLVGPNGSGKTTLVKLIFDLLRLRRGNIVIAGAPHCTKSGRASAQYLASNDYLPEFLRADEFLRLTADLYGERLDVYRAETLFTRYGMPGRLSNLMEDYSHGMRKKAQLISAFLMRRALTVIDETLNGIDVEALYLVEQELALMRSEGRSILLCSHDFAMLERVADRVVFLDHGRVIVDSTLDDLHCNYSSIAELVFSHLDDRI